MKAFGQTGKCKYSYRVSLSDGTGVLYSNGIWYCDKPCRWKIENDDDMVKYRQYDSLCPTHRAIVDALPDEEEY